jgi:hypothetical protein
MVTADGLVRILDFGVAKLTEPGAWGFWRNQFGETKTVRKGGPATSGFKVRERENPAYAGRSCS